jgi:hypothetical protein
LGLLDLYAVTVNNGIVTFECDSVSSWSDLTTTKDIFYGKIVDKELSNGYNETFKIYNTPIAIRKVEDYRFPDAYVYSPPGQPFVISATSYTAYNTVYKKASENLWIMYLEIVDNAFDTEQTLLRQYIGKQVTATIVDGKGVGSKYIGTLINVYDQGITSVGYGIEFDLKQQDGPELENVTSPPGINVLGFDLTISKIDSSSHIQIGVDYTVYEIGDVDSSDISSIKLKNDNGDLVSIPSNIIIFEDNKIKIPNDYLLNYKVSIPLNLEDFTTSTQSTVGYLYNGDVAMPIGSNQIDQDSSQWKPKGWEGFLAALGLPVELTTHKSEVKPIATIFLVVAITLFSLFVLYVRPDLTESLGFLTSEPSVNRAGGRAKVWRALADSRARSSNTRFQNRKRIPDFSKD